MIYQIARGYLSGLINGNVRRSGVRVFCYHGVVEKKSDPILERNFHTISSFRQQVSFLRRYKILSLAELHDELEDNSQPNERGSKPKAVITFDDGYENNLTVAEILQRAGLPWCLFVPTAAVGRDRIIWGIELALLILHGRATRVEAFDSVWRLDSAEARWRAYNRIAISLKRAPCQQRQAIMGDLRAQFSQHEAQSLLETFPSLRMLTWEQVSQLGSGGVEIGSHGVHHEIHHAGQSESQRSWELRESRTELESRLGVPCRYFSFPNGRFSPNSPNEVRLAGYDLAFTTQEGAVTKWTNPYLLPRLYASSSLTKFVIQFYWSANGIGHATKPSH